MKVGDLVKREGSIGLVVATYCDEDARLYSKVLWNDSQNLVIVNNEYLEVINEGR